MKKINCYMLALILIISFMVTGCQFEESTYKTLYTLNVSYDTAMESVNDLRKKGIMTPEQVDKAIGIGTIYYESFDLASDAFKAYLKTKRAEDKAKLVTILSELPGLLYELEKYVNIFEKEKP